MIELSTFVGPIIAAICSFAGAWLAFTNRLTRLETKLDVIEKKQDKHNDVIERTYKIEERLTYIDHAIDDIKTEIHRYHN